MASARYGSGYGTPKSLLADIKTVKAQLAKVVALYGPGHGPGHGKPKSILANIETVKSQLASLEKAQASLSKQIRDLSEAMVKQQSTFTQLGKKAAKKEKRRPSEYNLFLKDKMSAGMSMVDAVKTWKERQGGTSAVAGYGPGHGPGHDKPEETQPEETSQQ